MFAGGGSSASSGSAGGSGHGHGHHAGGAGGSASGGPSGHGHGHHSSAGAPPFSSQLAEANDLDALVFDFGSARCKFGYAGEDFPRVYESPLDRSARSVDRTRADFDAASVAAMADARRAARMELEPEKMAQWLFDTSAARLRTRMTDHPLLYVERPFAIPPEVANYRDADADDAMDGSSALDPRDPSSSRSKAGSTATPSAGSTTTTPSTTTGTTSNKKRDARLRERMVEVLMEDLGVPAVFFAKSPVLVCYANARTSGLVVELGATYSSVSTVHDGYAFTYPKSQVALFGGHDLDAFLRAKLAPQLERFHQQGLTTVDGEIAKRVPLESSHWWSYAIEAKESGLCRAADGAFDEAQNAQLPLINYELPDKTIVTLGTERFSVAEQLFARPEAESSDDATASSTTDASATSSSPILTPQGNHRSAINLPGLICETAGRSTEAELRRELFQNVVVSGGGSCFDNLPTRIEREVVASLSTLQLPLSAANYGVVAPLPNLRVKVVAAHAQERKVGAFLGGSILASLGSFHEMWLSKAEYAEHGAALVHKKCP